MPDGQLAVVQRLDRNDLADLSHLIPDWMAGSQDDDEGAGSEHGFLAFG